MVFRDLTMQHTLVLMGNCPVKSLHITLQMYSSVFKAGLLTLIIKLHSKKADDEIWYLNIYHTAV